MAKTVKSVKDVMFQVLLRLLEVAAMAQGDLRVLVRLIGCIKWRLFTHSWRCCGGLLGLLRAAFAQSVRTISSRRRGSARLRASWKCEILTRSDVQSATRMGTLYRTNWRCCVRLLGQLEAAFAQFGGSSDEPHLSRTFS